MEQLMNLVSEHGPWAAVAVYLIWQGRRDYKGVCNRLNDVEDYQKGVLTQLIEKVTKVCQEATEALQDNKKQENDK